MTVVRSDYQTVISCSPFDFYLFAIGQTDGSVPNTLVIANCEVVKPRVAAAEHISQVLFFYVLSLSSFFFRNKNHLDVIESLISQLQFNEEARSPFVKKFKTIIHPGEV